LPKTNPKNSHSLSQPAVDCPLLLKITRRCETCIPLFTRYPDSRSLRHYMAPLTSRAIPVISQLLCCVKWRIKNNLLL